MDTNEYKYSQALVNLFKGVVSSEQTPNVWETINDEQLKIEEYVGSVGLTLVIQKQDGYAYLKQRTYENEEKAMPRLVAKRQLGFTTSLLLALLRKEFAELNRLDSSELLVLSEDEMFEKLKPYLKDTTDEVKERNRVNRAIKQIEEMGFLRTIKNDKSRFEVLALVRGFVDVQWLEELDEKLQEYANYEKSSESEEN